MLFRLLAGLLGPLCAFAIGCPASAQPAAASPAPRPAPAASPWPYPKACLETELRRFEIWRDLEAHTQYLELLGASRPCAGNKEPRPGVRLALTQYRAVGDTFVGWMGDPWRTNSIGDMKFRRTGTLLGDDTTLCLSTGLVSRPDGVYAEHNRCFRVEWSDPAATYGYDLRDVPVDDKSVSVPLERVPEPGASAPAGCWNCLVTSATEPMPVPDPMPWPGTVEPKCARIKIDDTAVDYRGRITLTGSVRSCIPGHTDELYVASVFYGVGGGRLGQMWGIDEPDVHNFVRSTGLRVGENAFCITSGRYQTYDGSYAVHLICYAMQSDAAGQPELVRISTHDPRVRKPVDTLDDGDPGGTCATCL